MRHFWFSLALLALAVPALAKRADPSQANNGSFGAKLLITDDRDGFWKQWEQAETPHITTTSRVDVAKKVYGMVVFFGCRAAANGNCKVTAHFEMTGPDGRP